MKEKKSEKRIGAIFRNPLFITILGTVIATIITNDILPDLFASEPWVIINKIQLVSRDEENNSANYQIDVQYSYDYKETALLAIHCDYISKGTWSGLGKEGEKLITRGDGYHTFNVKVDLQNCDELSFKAYIHPFPPPNVEYMPLASSEEMIFHIN